MAGLLAAILNPLNYVGGVKFSPETCIPDLSGKVILVTGGNTGLGKETISQLIKHNPKKIYLGARSKSKAEDAIESMVSFISNDAKISWLPLDLTSVVSIKNAAEIVSAEFSQLDILVLNAGVMALPPGETEMGHDIQFGTNHTGHFYLTKLLLPILLKTAENPGSDVRIVSLSSEGHKLAPSFETTLNQDKLKKVNTAARYGASKAANIVLAAELNRRYPSITSVSVHPGIISTGLYSSLNQSSSVAALVSKTMCFFGSSISQGALNQLWAAAGAKKEELTSGGYYLPVGCLKNQNKYTTCEDTGKRLWEWTENELQKFNL